MLDKSLDGEVGTDNHQSGGEDEGEAIQELNSASSLLSKHDQVHESGEDEGGNVIGEVTDHT